MLHKLVLVCLALTGLWADDFTCPTGKISMNDGTTGSIPQGATSQFKFPNGTNCVFKFDVPLGFAIRMELSANYEISPGDQLKFDYFVISSGANKQVEWYMGPELFVSMVSVTGNLTFFATYSYVDVSGYTQVIKKTGEYFNSTLEAGKYYTVQGAVGDTVTYNMAERQTGFADQTTYEVFMFDGPDIINSVYIGRLTEYTRRINFHSETNTLTFLNLYNSPSDTVILGNDYSVVSALPEYHMYLIDPNSQTIGDFYEVRNQDTDSYYTLVCDMCDYFYIEGLTFFTIGETDPTVGYLEVQGMAPSQKLAPIYNYTYSTTANMSLPQLIPAPMATFHSYRSNIHFVLSSTAHLGYYNAGNGKIRSISTPTLWNPAANPNFDYTFSDPVKMFNFSINLESVQLVDDGDTLLVEVATTDGDMSLRNTYSKTSLSNVPLFGVGHYLNLKYSGGKNSQVIVNFQEIQIGGDSTTAPTTTAAAAPTTTVTRVPSTRVTVPSTATTQAPVTTSTSGPVVSSSAAPVTSTVPPTTGTQPSTQTVATSPATIATTTSSSSRLNFFIANLILLLAIL